MLQNFSSVSFLLKPPSKEIVQYLLNYICLKSYGPHFGKLLQSSTKGSKNCNPLTNYFQSFINSLQQYNYINILFHTIDICRVIYLHIFSYAHAASY